MPFPFTNQTASKKRPAIIASGSAYNQAKRVVVMAITSQLRPGAVLDEVRIVDWQATGLLKPSVVKPVFATLAQRLISRQPSRLAAADEATFSANVVNWMTFVNRPIVRATMELEFHGPTP